MDYEREEELEKIIRKKDLLIDILLERIEDEPHYSQVDYNKIEGKLELLQEKYDENYSKYLYIAKELEKANKKLNKDA